MLVARRAGTEGPTAQDGGLSAPVSNVPVNVTAGTLLPGPPQHRVPKSPLYR